MQKDLKELLVKLDELNSQIRQKSFDEKGTLVVDEKWLVFYDMILKDMIETKKTLDFVKDHKNKKWQTVLDMLDNMSS